MGARTWAAAALLAAGLATTTAGPVAADDTTVSGGTVTVTVVTDFPVRDSGWRIGRAINAWNGAQAVVHFVRATTPATSPDARTVYVHRYNADDSMGAYTLGDQIWLNERYHPRSTWRTTYTRCMSASIVAHELGHSVGLPHSADPADLMFGGPSSGTRPTCAHPSAGDVAALTALYAAAP